MRVAAVRSFLDSCALEAAIRDELGAPDLRLVALSFGVNDFYRVEAAAEPLVLRLSPANRWSPREVAAELALLRQLDGEKVEVGCPRCFANGSDLLSIRAPEGERTASLFGLVEGRMLADTEVDAADLGQAVGRIHTAGDPGLVESRLIYDSTELIDRPLVVITDRFAHMEAEMKSLLDFAREARPRLDQFFAQYSPGVIHGDVQLKNALRTPRGSVAMLDFDECGRGWAVDDVAVFLMLAHGHNRPDLADAFIGGYESERPLSEAERDVLEVLVRVRAIWAAGWQLRMAQSWGPAAWFDDEWLLRLTSPRGSADG